MKRLFPSLVSSALLLSCQPKSGSSSDAKLVAGKAATEIALAPTVHIGSCSGAKIAPRTYLTAKHCIAENGWMKDKALTIFRQFQGQNAWTLATTITDVQSHPTEDVGIVHIADDDSSLETARLFAGEEPRSQDVTMAGYGCVEMMIAEGRAYPGGEQPDYLQSASGKLMSVEATGSTDPRKFLYMKAKTVSMMSDQKVTSPALCPGDSGGPLWIKRGSGWEIWGVATGFHPYMSASIWVRVDAKATNGVSAWLGGVR